MSDEHQKAVGADGQAALPGLQPTDHQNRQEGEEDGEANQRDEGSRAPDGAAIAEPIALALVCQSPHLPVFGGIALDRQHAAEVVAESAGDIAGPFAHIGVARRQAALEAQGAPENHRNRQKRNPGNGG